ncbi:major facilitator superfamily domain-containing protein [Xylogone sp. PMI_703]|nr:major facilitator superfamily domain-containing protein [Xylogone sp. PMI_703]
MSSCETPKSPSIMEKDVVVMSAVNDSSVEQTDSESEFDRKLALKIDLRLLVPMLFLNFLSLMGRTNIGAALIQKLPQDLKLDANKIVLAISISLVPLILFEVPSNLIMRFLEKDYGFPYMRYLSVITICLGIVTLGQGFDKTYSALLATRFVVGIFDAGLIPGCVFVCSLYYPAKHLQWRMSMLMVSNIASNIVSNILAYAIAHIHNSNGYHGWRWIFIVEGCLTMGIGLVCCIPNISRPETCNFLTQKDKEIVAREVEQQTTTLGVAAEWRIFLTNPLNYVWASCYVLTCSTTYSVAIFAPSFVSAFHPTYTVPQVQGQVIPIFVVSAAACLISAWLSDKYNHRASYVLVGYLFTSIGYIILRQHHIFKPSIAMLGLYFVSIGTYISLPIIWNLTLVNLSTPFQRAIGCGFVVGIGNLGGFTSAWLFRTSQAPHYHDGMTDSLIFTLVSAALIASAWIYISFSNKARRTKADSQQVNADNSKQIHRYRV